MANTVIKKRTGPLVGSPLSRKELYKNGFYSPEHDFLDWYATRDTVHLFDDFLGDTIVLDNYAVANGGGAGVASFAISVQRDGWIRGETGTGNGATASASLIGPAIWYGAANAGFEARFKDAGAAVTETIIEMGLIDVVPGSTKSAVNNVSTPSVNTSVVEAALYHYRHTGSTTTNIGLGIGTAISAQKLTMTLPVAIAAAKSFTVRIQLLKTGSATADAHFWHSGVYQGKITLAMTGDVALAPWLYVQRTTATTTYLDVDYLRVWQDRDFESTGLGL